MSKLIGLSLFASGGISEYYLDKTNVKIVVANELLPKRCEFYKELYKDSHMICGSIVDKKIYDNIITKSKELKVDFIMATPPCQGMSKAGKMNYDDPRNSLFLYIIDIIKELKPKYVLIENVPELLKSNFKDIDMKERKIMDKINQELNENYIINSSVLNSMNYDVAQSRKRAIILFSRKDITEWKIPDKKNNIITVRDMIEYLPSIEADEKITDFNTNNINEKNNIINWHYGKKHNSRHILWMKNTPTGKSAFDNLKYYPNIDGRRIRGFKTTYKRISWDKPAPTITMANGSISSQNNVHPGRLKKDKTYSDARVLSVFELLLLTSLPKDIILPKCSTDKLIRDLLGECVPSKFMYNLIKSIPY
jgi:DNA (cytosine-5)-methyltransferase 1